MLCERIEVYIKRQNTQFRRCICVEHHVAITLWTLATCSEYYDIQSKWPKSKELVHWSPFWICSLHSLCDSTCKVIVDVLLKEHIQFSNGRDLVNVIEGFKSKLNMIRCAGTIDGSHISVSPPAMNHIDYYNRKGWYSVIVQAVVDHEYLFCDICVGWPGNVHDAQVLASSSLYRKATNGDILFGNVVNVNGTNIPIFLISDSAYPLRPPWPMKPFPHNSTLSCAQRSFNFHLSSSCIVIENAFGRLNSLGPCLHAP